MQPSELERGMTLHYAIENGDDLECSVVSSETEFADDDMECVEVCFLDAGAGYSRGEVGYVNLDSLREFMEELK